MAELTQLWVDGVIGPIHPHMTYDISRLEEAMVYFSKGVHVGKIVITFDNPQVPLKVRYLFHGQQYLPANIPRSCKNQNASPLTPMRHIYW
jgi:hypothetical protein